jgi:hypothetical protein
MFFVGVHWMEFVSLATDLWISLGTPISATKVVTDKTSNGQLMAQNVLC